MSHRLRPASVLVTSVLAAAPASADLIHRWNFEGTGTVVSDVVGGAHGVVMGGAGLNGNGGCQLDGVDDFVDLPNGLLGGLTDVTFEGWLNWDANAPVNWQRIFDFGNSIGGEDQQGGGTNYLMLTPASDSWSQAMFSISTSGSAGEQRAYAPMTFLSGAPTHFAVTFKGDDRATLFIDGVFMGSVKVTIPLSAIDDVNNWLGKSQWPDPFLGGTFHEFRMYDEALTELEVAMSYADGADLPGLVGHPAALSIAAGGIQTLELTADPAFAGDAYLLLGTFTGTSPGIPVDGSLLPINLDSYTIATLTGPNAPPLQNSFGVLPTDGKAIAQFTLPPGAQALLPGMELHHAFLVFQNLQVAYASNAAICEMTP